MLGVALVFVVLGFGAALNFAYSLGRLQGRDILPERREGLIVVLLAPGLFFGVALAAYLADTMQLGGMTRAVVLFGLSLAGAAAAFAAGNRLLPSPKA